MSKPVSLLVCLSPSVPNMSINELSFYSMVNPIGKVTNLKIFGRDDQLKAFVEVENQKIAKMVLEKLHGKLLNIGKVKVFTSDKDKIVYKRTLNEVLSSCNGLLNLHTDNAPYKFKTTLESLKSGNNHMSQNFNPFELKSRPLAFNNLAQKSPPEVLRAKHVSPTDLDKAKNLLHRNSLKVTDIPTYNDHNVVEEKSLVMNQDQGLSSIKVTHDDVDKLTEKNVRKVFRRFGRIFDLRFNSYEGFWEICYKSEKDVQKALKAIRKNKIFGFKLYEASENAGKEEEQEMVIPGSCKRHENNYPHIGKIKGENKASITLSKTIKLIVRDNKHTIAEICRLIASVHVPIWVAETVDMNEKQKCFLAEFSYCYEAAEVSCYLTMKYGVQKELKVILNPD